MSFYSEPENHIREKIKVVLKTQNEKHTENEIRQESS